MDVCVSGDKLLAMEIVQSEIQAFLKSNDKWTLVSSFNLRDTDTRLKHFHVNNDTISISYHWKEKVTLYSLEGDFLEEFGGERQLGEFSGPVMLGTDWEGSLVVGNHGHTQVKTRNSQGEWEQHALYRLTGVESLLDVLKVHDRLYVLWGFPAEKLIIHKIHLS